MKRRISCRTSWFALFIGVTLFLNIYLVLDLLASKNISRDPDETDIGGKFHSTRITFILNDFEDFRNDLLSTVGNLSIRFSAVSQILVITKRPLYPVQKLSNFANVRVVVTDPLLGHPISDSRPESFIQSEYVIFVPDSVRASQNMDVDYMIDFLVRSQIRNRSITMAAWPLISDSKCVLLNVNLKKWTLRYMQQSNDNVCDSLHGGDFVLLISKRVLLNFTYPFLTPYERTLFIQNTVAGNKIIVDNRQNERRWYRSADLFVNDSHSMWKHNRSEQAQLRHAYSKLGIKLIEREQYLTAIPLGNSRRFTRNSVSESSRNHRVEPKVTEEWYGCAKDTPRCFGTVLHDMPDYLSLGRWTPPCCLKALRQTARHVFTTLASQGVRYWLEGGSLLGAARSGDIIPWDYDVDIGIYKSDILRSFHLVSCQNGAYEDEEGYVWERASEGDFFRVQYSRTNHLHVDIFPFYSRNGTMTKDTWFSTHRQDMEFSEAFLRPLGSIGFVGMNASAPNDVRRFLELKFGEGVIENPRYPDSASISQV